MPSGSPRRPGKRAGAVTKMREDNEIAYFEAEVKPLLDPGDEMPAEMPLDAQDRAAAGADAMLNPITWREPFGLVMAEALACGTPVLAFPNGAAPEIIDPGRTGFLCRDEGEMISAVDRVARSTEAVPRRRRAAVLAAADGARPRAALPPVCSSASPAHAPDPGRGPAHQRIAQTPAVRGLRRARASRPRGQR